MEENKGKILNISNAITAIILLFILMIAISIPLLWNEKEQEVAIETIEQTEEKIQKFYIDPFENIDLESKSAIVWDIKNQKVLFSKNSEKISPLASITKILTASLSYDILPKDTEIRIRPEFLDTDGDSGLFADESWRLRDLLDFTLMTSSNDGARAIASIAGSIIAGTENMETGRESFVQLMNQKASEIGLSNVLIRDETGLDKNEFQSGSYGTAKDVALLFDYVYKTSPEVFESTAKSQREFTSLNLINHEAENTNKIIDEIPGIIGSKTGFTDLAGGNLGIIFDPSLGHPIVTVVLDSSYDGRFTDSKKLIEATQEYLIQEKLKKYDN